MDVSTFEMMLSRKKAQFSNAKNRLGGHCRHSLKLIANKSLPLITAVSLGLLPNSLLHAYSPKEPEFQSI